MNACRTTGREQIVRLLSPLDSVVWDRRHFKLLWGWRPLRSLHAGAKTPARVLCACSFFGSAARDRLTQSLNEPRRGECPERLRRLASARWCLFTGSRRAAGSDSAPLVFVWGGQLCARSACS